MKLLLNAVQCLTCGDVIASHHRHDFKSCRCGKTSVDGGLDYRRRLGTNYAECCAYRYNPTHSFPRDAAGKWIVWSPGGNSNPVVIFDRQGDAEESAKELASRVPPSAWFVAQLTHVQTRG